jgi:hypothetical protein
MPTMTITIPLILAIVGALIYGFAGHPKAANLGLWIFVCSFFWVVGQLTTGHGALFR